MQPAMKNIYYIIKNNNTHKTQIRNYKQYSGQLAFRKCPKKLYLLTALHGHINWLNSYIFCFSSNQTMMTYSLSHPADHNPPLLMTVEQMFSNFLRILHLSSSDALTGKTLRGVVSEREGEKQKMAPNVYDSATIIMIIIIRRRV